MIISAGGGKRSSPDWIDLDPVTCLAGQASSLGELGSSLVEWESREKGESAFRIDKNEISMESVRIVTVAFASAGEVKYGQSSLGSTSTG